MKRLLDRTLFAPVAAVRPYLLLKLTVLLLPLDMWLTRASHGGRYGAGGFNVAHFPWLDAIQPPVSPAMFVGICALTGLLCFMIAIATRPPRWLIGVVFVLHTWSWAMSMLDSYQHHYLLSLVLLALMFFPALSAEEALLVPEPPAPEPKPRKGKKKKTQEPTPRPASAALSPTPYVSAWAYGMLAASVGMVYGYTAYAKTDPEWLSGAALRRVLHLPDSGVVPVGQVDPIGPFRDILEMLGLEGEALWSLMGHSVVLVQIICAAGYVLAPFLDVSRHWAPKAFAWVAMATALSFHFGAEYMGLKIGWFSWYMIGYALLFLLPGRWLTLGARVVIPLPGRPLGPEVMALRFLVGGAVLLAGATAGSWTEMAPFGVSLAEIFGDEANLPLMVLGGAMLALTPIRFFTHAIQDPSGDLEGRRKVALGTVAVSAIAVAVVGYRVVLPGAAAAGVIAAVGLGVALIVSFLRGDDPRGLHGYAVGALVGALAFIVSISFSVVRWDYYRNMGGDHRRRGEYRESYIAYVLANRYAPEGEDRLERQREMEARLRASGDLPAAP